MYVTTTTTLPREEGRGWPSGWISQMQKLKSLSLESIAVEASLFGAWGGSEGSFACSIYCQELCLFKLCFQFHSLHYYEWNVAQLVQHQTGMPLTQVRFPCALRDCSPRVNFQCRLSYGVRTPPCAIACIYICEHVKDPVVYVRGRLIMEALEAPNMHCRLSSATLSQLAFPGKETQISQGGNPNGTIQYSYIFPSPPTYTDVYHEQRIRLWVVISWFAFHCDITDLRGWPGVGFYETAVTVIRKSSHKEEHSFESAASQNTYIALLLTDSEKWQHKHRP